MDCLISNEQNGILILRLNRPEKHNSLNGDLLQALEQAINHAKQKASIRAILLMLMYCTGKQNFQLQKDWGQNKPVNDVTAPNDL